LLPELDKAQGVELVDVDPGEATNQEPEAKW
jgi:hypothetical protein